MPSHPFAVLYIEDNEANCRLMQKILEFRPAIALRLAMSGKLGVESAMTQPPQLILLDLDLPDISGEEVYQQIRAIPELSAIPIIILSSDDTPDRIRPLLTAGAVSYVSKPLDVRAFLGLIDMLVQAAET